MKIEHKEEEVKEAVERTAEEIQDGEVISSIPVQEKVFEFTEDEKTELDVMMNQIRANHILAQDLAKLNMEHSENLHKRIREIHPDLVGVEYMYNPSSKKIQFRKDQ